ncbi:hypothetical protein HDU93_002105 [Gonapodya sp. JEL0774]|nr:hypothetical protein HDU93_002105 [Gonapodya sp. JEL0774]
MVPAFRRILEIEAETNGLNRPEKMGVTIGAVPKRHLDSRTPAQLGAVVSDITKARARTTIVKTSVSELREDLINLKRGSFSLVLADIARQRDQIAVFEQVKANLETLRRIHVLSSSVTAAQPPRSALNEYLALFDEWTDLESRDSSYQSVRVLKEFVTRGVEEAWTLLSRDLTAYLKSSFNLIGWPAQLPELYKLTLRAVDQLRKAIADTTKAQRVNRSKPSSITLVRTPLQPQSFFKTIASEAPLEPFPPLPHGKQLGSEPLLAIQVLAEPVVVRLRYHFGGRRETDRLDKPEWIFQYVLHQIESSQAFLVPIVQPVLDTECNAAYRVETELLHNLLPTVLSKLRRLNPELRMKPHLLPHHVSECIRFDLRINSMLPPELSFPCTRVITDNDDVFESWVTAEEQVAKYAFEECFGSARAWMNGENGGTLAAEGIVGVLEGITSRYASLPTLRHRAIFLSRVQLPLAAEFMARLQDLYDAHVRSTALTLIGDFVGAVGVGTGGGGKQQPSKVEEDAVLELCKWATSAAYVKETLALWDESVFFISLWDDMRSNSTAKEILHSARDLKSDRHGAYDTLFGGLIRGYRSLEERILSSVVTEVVDATATEMRSYDQKRDWRSPLFASSAAPDTSPELAPALNYLSHTIDVLRSNLPSACCVSVISKAGGMQLRADANNLANAVLGKGQISSGTGSLSFWRLSEAAFLLSLPSTYAPDQPNFETALSVAKVHESIRSIDMGGSDDDKVEFLSRIGLRHLTWAETRRVVNRRADLGYAY